MKTTFYENNQTYCKYDRDHLAIYFNETPRTLPAQEGQQAQVVYDYDTVMVATTEPSVEAFVAALVAAGYSLIDAQVIAYGIIFAAIQKGELAGDPLTAAKQMVTAKITQYDASPAVNEFTYQGTPMWLDKDTRAGLMLRLNAEQAAGHETTTLWYGTTAYTLAVADAKQMLTALELYASGCFDCTEQHKVNVESKRTVNTVLNYDYTTGYPAKLEF